MAIATSRRRTQSSDADAFCFRILALCNGSASRLPESSLSKNAYPYHSRNGHKRSQRSQLRVLGACTITIAAKGKASWTTFTNDFFSSLQLSSLVLGLGNIWKGVHR